MSILNELHLAIHSHIDPCGNAPNTVAMHPATLIAIKKEVEPFLIRQAVGHDNYVKMQIWGCDIVRSADIERGVFHVYNATTLHSRPAK